jgi:hypothetical protein
VNTRSVNQRSGINSGSRKSRPTTEHDSSRCVIPSGLQAARDLACVTSILVRALYHVSWGIRDNTNMKSLLCLATLALFALPIFAACPRQSKDAKALIQLEQTWALALEAHDADAVGCILAEEFQDADPEGKLHNRAETLAQIPHRRPGKNILSELDPHVFGDFGYIRGLATLVDGEGKTRARVRFTDIYIYRDQRWVAVAGQESLLPEPAK